MQRGTFFSSKHTFPFIHFFFRVSSFLSFFTFASSRFSYSHTLRRPRGKKRLTPNPHQDLVSGLDGVMFNDLMENIEWFFNMHDKNKDGYLTKDEVLTLSESFLVCLFFRILVPTVLT